LEVVVWNKGMLLLLLLVLSSVMQVGWVVA
jgi:hypothetical protein